MAASNNLGFDFVSQAQAQKEVTVNEALQLIDAILNTGAIDRGLNTPPGTPADGDLYILGSSPTGAWSGHAGDIAFYTASAWHFLDPQEGMTLWVNDEDTLYTFNGATWGNASSVIQNASLLGINTTADATNKLAVASSAILFQHNGTNIQVKVNKASASDTGSLLFQTAASGRAEIGCVGNDDFSFKVSPDGVSFYTGIVLDKSTGRATIKDSFLSVGAPQSLTIASGAIAATKSFIAIDTEAAAASDDLDTITGGAAGDMLILSAANDARTVVVKNGTGNLALGGSDFSLTHSSDRLWLHRTASGWVELGRSDNAA